MKDTLYLVNDRASILDLSGVTDVTGTRVVLRPVGEAGDRRECFATAEDHPHVQSMLKMRWLRIERSQLDAPPTVLVPAAEPSAPKAEAVPAPADMPTLATAPDAPAPRTDVPQEPADADPTHEAAEPSTESRRRPKRG